MKIYFDTAFDGRIWPGWSSKKNGSVGVKWLGPLGMLDILETLLGLKGPTIPDSIRAAHIVLELSKNENSRVVEVSGKDKRLKTPLIYRSFLHRIDRVI